MGLLSDAGLDSFHSTIGCKLKQSKDILNKTLEKATTVSNVAFMLRSGSIKAMKRLEPELVTKWNERFERIYTIESELGTFLSPAWFESTDFS